MVTLDDDHTFARGSLDQPFDVDFFEWLRRFERMWETS